jgi:hypothetical protein
MFNEVHRDDLQRRVGNPQANFALACWNLARGERAAPDDASFRRFVTPTLSADMVVMQVLPNDEFLYGHFGAGVADHAGYSMAGRRVSDFGSVLREFHTRLYAEAVARRSPIVSLHRLGHYRERPLWERLILPCADEDGVGAIYVVNTVREIQHDARHLVVRERDNGLIVMEFPPAGIDAAPRATIIGANNAALAIVGRRLDELIDQDAADCFPAIRESGLWDVFVDVALTRRPRRHRLPPARGEASAGVDVAVSPFHHGICVEFPPLSGALFR